MPNNSNGATTAATAPVTTEASPQRKTFLKYLSLGLLVPHTIIYTLLASIARRPDAQGHVFFGPSAVVMIECLKVVVSTMGITYDAAATQRNDTQRGDYIPIVKRSLEGRNAKRASVTEEEKALREDEEDDKAEFDELEVEMDSLAATSSPTTRRQAIWNAVKQEVFTTNGFRLIPPALLYVCQNNLQVFASGCLTPAEYQIVGQTKMAFIAVFSVLILKRQLNMQHWLSIATLVLGTIIVQSISVRETHKGNMAAAAGAEAMTPQSADMLPQRPVRSQQQLLIGTIAMLGASACSGLGGVLVEKLLKKKMPFWTTNVHLAFFSLVPAIVPVVTNIFYTQTFAPFRYFTPIVYGLVAFNIVGGIIASLTMKYADNILKNIAVAISLIGTVFLSSAVSGIPITMIQLLGTALVVAAIAGYARA